MYWNSNSRSSDLFFEIDSSIKTLDMGAHFWTGIVIEKYSIRINGNGCTIKELSCVQSDSSNGYVGFFSLINTLGASGRVSNITFKDCNATTLSGSVGILYGRTKTDPDLESVTFDNCYVGGEGYYAGIVAGYYNMGNSGTLNIYIRNCKLHMVYSNSSASNLCIGGFCGYLASSSSSPGHQIDGINISGLRCDAYGYGNIENIYVGGLVGYNDDASSARICNCSVQMTVATYDAPCSYVGGLFGRGRLYYGNAAYQKGAVVDVRNATPASDTTVASRIWSPCVAQYQGTEYTKYQTKYQPQSVLYYSTDSITDNSGYASTGTGKSFDKIHGSVSFIDDKTNTIPYEKYTIADELPDGSIDDLGNFVYINDAVALVDSRPYPIIRILHWDTDGEGCGFVERDLPLNTPECVYTKTDGFTIPIPKYPSGVSKATFNLYVQTRPESTWTSDHYVSEYESGQTIYNLDKSKAYKLSAIELETGTSHQYKKSSSTMVETSGEYYKNANGNLVKSERTYNKKNSTTLV